MFDLIVNAHRDTTRRGLAPLVISWSVHALVLGPWSFCHCSSRQTTSRLSQKETLIYVTVAAPPPPPLHRHQRPRRRR